MHKAVRLCLETASLIIFEKSYRIIPTSSQVFLKQRDSLQAVFLTFHQICLLRGEQEAGEGVVYTALGIAQKQAQAQKKLDLMFFFLEHRQDFDNIALGAMYSVWFMRYFYMPLQVKHIVYVIKLVKIFLQKMSDIVS